MALFRRNKVDQAGMPTDVQNYYQTENRERTGMAWLLALGTLLVTVIVVLGLFFGGRWTFRKLKNTDKPAPVAVQTDKSKEDDHAEEPATTPPANETPSTQGSSTPQSSSTTATPNSSVASNTPSAATRSAGQAGMPATGPADTLAIFIVASVIGTLFYERRLWLRNR